jgi:hypothetical protein
MGRAMADPNPPSDGDRAAMLDAAAAVLGLTVAPEWRGEILFHMKVIGETAQRLMEFPLDDSVEPAPIFTP